MSKYCAVIVNPTAGGYAERTVTEVMAALRGYGISPQLFLTRSAEDATLFARQICREREEPFIIAGGGDGTVNGVLNGLAPGKATLALLPLGTSNVLARELGIDSVTEALVRIRRRKARHLSVGLLEGTGLHRYFLLMAGIGFDGAVVEGVRLGEKRWLKQGAYLLSAVRHLIEWERESFPLIIDGRQRECHSAVICNGSRYGGRFVMAPEGDIFSPGFQVVCVKSAARRAYARMTIRMMSGRGIAGPDVEIVAAREITFPGGRAIQADGDLVGRDPVCVRTVEGLVRIVV